MRFILLIGIISAFQFEDINILDSSRYLPLEDMFKFLTELAAKASNSVKLKSVGNTYIKGKPWTYEVYLVTIGNKEDPILFFDCGMHAREWISSATCLYLIQNLALAFELHRKVRKKIYQTSLFNYQWHFMPMMNPDGYMTTHQKDLSGEHLHRMHRKNRRPLETMNLTEEMETHCDDEGDCEGVDLNRNFPSGWGEGYEDFVKDSNRPWTYVYKGTHPFSEPETQALHRHFETIKDRVLVANSIHSYGKDIYYPKGWLSEDHPDQIKGKEREHLRSFAINFNKALKYRIGSVAELLTKKEQCGGASDDYYWTAQGINLTYTIELDPPLEDHHTGFKLPPANIKKVGKKMWEAVKAMAERLDWLYPQYNKQS